eukprot:9075722-Pyramimonas_sp.AAC.2
MKSCADNDGVALPLSSTSDCIRRAISFTSLGRGRRVTPKVIITHQSLQLNWPSDSVHHNRVVKIGDIGPWIHACCSAS